MKLFFLLLFIHATTFASEWDFESSGIYKVKAPTSLEDILIKKFKLPPETLVLEVDGQNLLSKIEEMNPHIKKWSPIPSGSHLYLELPKEAAFEKRNIERYNKARNASHASPKYLKQVLRK